MLDRFEARERARLRAAAADSDSHADSHSHSHSHLRALADADALWGNDGLVTVQSARWGELLGVLDGCDHWALRGARGLDVDLPALPLPALSLPAADAWGIADWGRFVRAWRREEKAAKRAGEAMGEQGHSDGAVLAAAGAGAEVFGESRGDGDGESARADRTDPRTRSDRASMNADEVVKSSTAKVSAVFDWIVDQVPSPSLSSPSPSSSPPSSPRSEPEQGRAEKKAGARKSDLATKMDLERFYVALCRKLYDEGL